MQAQWRQLKYYDPKDFPSYLPKLNRLYDDLFSGGKGFRSKLVNMVAGPIQLDEKPTHLLQQTIEFIHNASLLHDDLVDRSHLRRSKPTAWLKYTPEYAVLAGDYLLARVMVNLSSFGNIQLVHYTSEMISELLEGEWIQDSLVGDFDVTVEQLDRVHDLKTATLFRWCLRSPFVAQERFDADLHAILGEMGSVLGLLFQRSDDLLDFDIRNGEKKKPLGDLQSGYFNSFAAFLMSQSSNAEKTSFSQCASMEDVRRNLGEGVLEARLKEFDRMNEEQIEYYNHLCGELARLLPEREQKVVENLRPLNDLLYWRKT